MFCITRFVLIGTAVSAFLLAMALLNLFILFNVWRQFRSVTRGESVRAHIYKRYRRVDDACCFQRTFLLVTSSWHMYFVGFLFV